MIYTTQLDTVKCYTADDTNLLYISKSMKRINKHINHDLSLIVQWLRSNKISLNADKTELVIFSPKRKKIAKHITFRISGEKIEISTRVKYLGIQIDQHLNWDEHIKNIIPKLSRATGVLSKIRHYIYTYILVKDNRLINFQFSLNLCLPNVGSN